MSHDAVEPMLYRGYWIDASYDRFTVKSRAGNTLGTFGSISAARKWVRQLKRSTSPQESSEA